jgi:hypothetical protein
VLATILELPLEQLPDPSKRAAHNADGLNIVALDETDVEPDAMAHRVGRFVSSFR